MDKAGTPHYEFYCEKCEKEVTLTLSIGERERGADAIERAHEVLALA